MLRGLLSFHAPHRDGKGTTDESGLTGVGHGGKVRRMAVQRDEGVKVATWLDPEQADRLKEIADREDRSVSSVIRRAVIREIELHEAAA